MNKPFYIIIFLLLFCCEAKTQTNLIYNGDFEIFDTCPVNISTPGDLQIEHCLGWTAPTKLGTSDYFNVCNNSAFSKPVGVPKNQISYQAAYNGNAYTGFFVAYVDTLNNQLLNYREYIQTKLTKSLEKNKLYNFSFYVSAANNSHCFVKIGAVFSNTNFFANNYDPIFTSPQVVNTNFLLQDTLNWMKIEGDFISNGTEEYVTIGYFENNYSDAVKTFDDPNNEFWQITSYYFVDGISLIELPCDINVPNIFTPNNDGINDIMRFENCDTIIDFIIYNRWGVKIFETNKTNNFWDGRTTSGEMCEDGTYFYLITTETKKEKGFIQLVR